MGKSFDAIDELIARMVGARGHTDYLAACRALERVITHSHYLLPQWYSPVHNMAYNAWRLHPPAVTPAYFQAETWAIWTWWARSAEAAASPRGAP